MAEAQRERKKKKPKEKTSEAVDTLVAILDEVTKPEAPQIAPDLTKIKPEVIHTSPRSVLSQTQPRTTPAISVEEKEGIKLEPGKVNPQIKPILPAWVKKPWRWMIPEDPTLKEQWLLTWGEFLLDFSRVLKIHIIDLQEISLVYPFQNTILNKKLTIPQIISICDHLVELEKAKWWDSEKTRLRVYWKTLKAFADDLYAFSYDNGYDMVTVYDIVKMKQAWSSLPPSDIQILMKLLVENNRASWADSDRKTIEFHYE